MRSGGRDRVRRVLGLVVLLGFAMVSLTGCLRVHVALAVSQDDIVSGEFVIAALPTNREDKGPVLTVPDDLADKVKTEPYTADKYVGQKVTVTGLRFADVTRLVETISTVQKYRLSFRRSGDLVTLAGSLDLTQVPADRADVQIKVAFPGQISRTNGDNTDGTVTWNPKPTSVTELSVTAQYTDSSGVSWTQWVAMVAGGAVFVALLVVLLALFAHRRALRAERAQAAPRGMAVR